MVDHSELKKLAEAAPEGPWFGPEYAPGTSYVFDVDLGTLLEYQSIDTEKDACLRYVAAANPAAVLALIAENERLESFKAAYMEWTDKTEWVQKSAQALELGQHRADVLRSRIDQLKAESAGLKTGYEAYERVNAELKAEMEVLRKALESCAEELAAEVICKHGGQKLEDMHPVTRRLYDRDMAPVIEARAAMGKGGRS